MDYIVYFDTSKIGAAQVASWANYFNKSGFRGVFLPNPMSIETYSEDSLRSLRQHIDNLLNEKR